MIFELFIVFNILSNTSYIPLYHTRLQMVDVAVEEGGGTNSGKGLWGEGLELANVVGSGVVAVSLSLL